MNMSDETLSSRDTHGAGEAHRGPDPLVTGNRVLRAIGLWLLAAVVIGTATVFAARSSGAAAVTAIVVAEVYTLLIAALTIAFRPRTAVALGLVRCQAWTSALHSSHAGGDLSRVEHSTIGVALDVGHQIVPAMGSDDARLDGWACRAATSSFARVLAALERRRYFGACCRRGSGSGFRRARRSPSLPRHLPRSMASLRFSPSLSSWGSASVGCMSDPVQRCQPSSFTRFTMPRSSGGRTTPAAGLRGYRRGEARERPVAISHIPPSPSVMVVTSDSFSRRLQ